MSPIEQAEQLRADGKCIVCEKPVAKDEVRRGLCVMHYNRFDRAKKRCRTAGEAKALESLLIKQGHLLPARQGRTTSEPDVFAETLNNLKRYPFGDDPDYQEDFELWSDEEADTLIADLQELVDKAKADKKILLAFKLEEVVEQEMQFQRKFKQVEAFDDAISKAEAHAKNDSSRKPTKKKAARKKKRS